MGGVDLPARSRDLLAGYAATAVGTGRSGAEVLRLLPGSGAGIAAAFGAPRVARFFESYGQPMDAQRIGLYRLMVESF